MVLVDLLSALGGILRVKERADIDNAIFKLHYRITTSILLTFCILVTTTALVGEPIKCAYQGSDTIKESVANTYCWIHTTFTLPKYLHSNEKYVPNPGHGPYTEDDEKVYHAYYQWVPFVLFFQGIIFYSPHWLWKAWEGRKMESMVMGLSNPILSHEERKEKIKMLADYMLCALHRHNFYAFKYFICEILNFLNALFNMWFLDLFLGGMFLNLGVDFVHFINKEPEDRTDPLVVLFPRVTKCTFRMFGPSGTPERRDMLCILALNVLNEKIYVFLWFWFMFLVIVSALGLVYKAIIYFLPVIRIGLLHKKAKSRYKNSTKVMLKNLKVGDCFILHLLSKNIELLSFNSLMEEIYLRLDNTSGINSDVEIGLSDSAEQFRLVRSMT